MRRGRRFIDAVEAGALIDTAKEMVWRDHLSEDRCCRKALAENPEDAALCAPHGAWRHFTNSRPATDRLARPLSCRFGAA